MKDDAAAAAKLVELQELVAFLKAKLVEVEQDGLRWMKLYQDLETRYEEMKAGTKEEEKEKAAPASSPPAKPASGLKPKTKKK